MIDHAPIPTVEEALGQTRQQMETLVGLTQQQRAAIGTDPSTAKTGDDFPRSQSFKSEAGLATLFPD